MILHILTILIIFFLSSCEPEDGWCSSDRHSGDNDFNCSQMDKDFSCSGESVLSNFTDKIFVYRKSEVADGTNFETVMERPEYIPESLTFTSMTSCILAPKFSGVICKNWTEFELTTDENIPVKASSRSGDKTSSPCDPRYLEFEFEEKDLSGIKSGSDLFINDTVLKNNAEIKVRHYFVSE